MNPAPVESALESPRDSPLDTAFDTPLDAAPFAATAAVQTAAIVVVYKDIRRVATTLSLLRADLGCVVLVDNAEQRHTGLDALAAELQVHYLHRGNIGGLAGAYNLALRWLERQTPAPERVVFLDEDSDVAALAGFLADASTVAALADPATAAVSPAYRDRATELRGRYLRLSRFSFDFYPREFSEVRDVAFLINSMSVWRAAALRRVGDFNEALAVDHVDTEYCLRARHAGLKLRVNGAHEFAHSIGQRIRYRFLGMELQAGGHPPARRYLIGRNTVWLARRWLWREPAFAALCATRLAYEAAGITIAEPQPGRKLWALLRGAARGVVSGMKSVRHGHR